MILQTERLIIRKFKPTDLASLIDLFADPEVMKYIGPRRAMTEDEAQKWLSDMLLQQEHILTRYAAALRESDELIGVAGLRDEEGIKRSEERRVGKEWRCGWGAEYHERNRNVGGVWSDIGRGKRDSGGGC